MSDSPTPDPRFLGGEKGMVVTNANDMAFVLAVGWDGAVDMQANVDKPHMATILRQIADAIDSPTSTTDSTDKGEPNARFKRREGERLMAYPANVPRYEPQPDRGVPSGQPERTAPWCPTCGGEVYSDLTCHTYPQRNDDGTERWMACLPCDSATYWGCESDDCRWSYTQGLNPRNPRSEQNERNRPPWLPPSHTAAPAQEDN